MQNKLCTFPFWTTLIIQGVKLQNLAHNTIGRHDVCMHQDIGQIMGRFYLTA